MDPLIINHLFKLVFETVSRWQYKRLISSNDNAVLLDTRERRLYDLFIVGGVALNSYILKQYPTADLDLKLKYNGAMPVNKKTYNNFYLKHFNPLRTRIILEIKDVLNRFANENQALFSQILQKYNDSFFQTAIVYRHQYYFNNISDVSFLVTNCPILQEMVFSITYRLKDWPYDCVLVDLSMFTDHKLVNAALPRMGFEANLFYTALADQLTSRRERLPLFTEMSFTSSSHRAVVSGSSFQVPMASLPMVLLDNYILHYKHHRAERKQIVLRRLFYLLENLIIQYPKLQKEIYQLINLFSRIDPTETGQINQQILDLLSQFNNPIIYNHFADDSYRLSDFKTRFYPNPTLVTTPTFPPSRCDPLRSIRPSGHFPRQIGGVNEHKVLAILNRVLPSTLLSDAELDEDLQSQPRLIDEAARRSGAYLDRLRTKFNSSQLTHIYRRLDLAPYLLEHDDLMNQFREILPNITSSIILRNYLDMAARMLAPPTAASESFQSSEKKPQERETSELFQIKESEVSPLSSDTSSDESTSFAHLVDSPIVDSQITSTATPNLQDLPKVTLELPDRERDFADLKVVTNQENVMKQLRLDSSWTDEQLMNFFQASELSQQQPIDQRNNYFWVIRTIDLPKTIGIISLHPIDYDPKYAGKPFLTLIIDQNSHESGYDRDAIIQMVQLSSIDIYPNQNIYCDLKESNISLIRLFTQLGLIPIKQIILGDVLFLRYLITPISIKAMSDFDSLYPIKLTNQCLGDNLLIWLKLWKNQYADALLQKSWEISQKYISSPREFSSIIGRENHTLEITPEQFQILRKSKSVDEISGLMFSAIRSKDQVSFPFKKFIRDYDPIAAFRNLVQLNQTDRWRIAQNTKGMFCINSTYFEFGIRVFHTSDNHYYINHDHTKHKTLLVFQPRASDYQNIDWISDYFTEHIRLKCSVKNNPSPIDKFYHLSDPTFFTPLLLNEKQINTYNLNEYLHKEWRACTQFKPTLFYYLIKFLKAQDILDTSAGWGDRLIGSLAAGVNSYTGIEPEGDLIASYTQIINKFKNLSPNREMRTSFIQSGSENFESQQQQFDLVFSSPPFYDFETYSSAFAKSLEKTSPSAWAKKFMFRTIFNGWEGLKIDGYYVLYICNNSSFRLTEIINLWMQANLADSLFLGTIATARREKGYLTLWVYQKKEKIRKRKELDEKMRQFTQAWKEIFPPRN